MDTATLTTPLGDMTLRATANGLTSCLFGARSARNHTQDPTDDAATAQRWLVRARRELEAYFAGDLTVFTVPVDLRRVDESVRRVLDALEQIEHGQTTTYGRLAVLAGDTAPQGAQHAGTAMARNPLLIRLPCHRVLGADQALRGYRGGLARKRALLDLEAATGTHLDRQLSLHSG